MLPRVQAEDEVSTLRISLVLSSACAKPQLALTTPSCCSQEPAARGDLGWSGKSAGACAASAAYQ